MTVLEGIQKSAEFLARKDIDSPRLQAELLLAHVLKLPRMQLYLNFSRVLSGGETEALRELVIRRGHHEPWQHIAGSTSFCGLEIAVNREVLVPRPETELLAELGWNFLSNPGVRATQNEAETAQAIKAAAGGGGNPCALDFGTGSGCIAIALAVHCPAAKICAIDVSAESIAVARQNAARHSVSDRIEFIQCDGFPQSLHGRQFELVISNPPYIPSTEIELLQPEVRDHDPRSALDGGPDGLDCFRRLAAGAGMFLRPGGRFMAEFGDGQAAAVMAIFKRQNWIVEAIKEDYTQRPRYLIARF